jgi:hypothetical protein
MSGAAATIIFAIPRKLPNEPTSKLRYATNGRRRSTFFSGPTRPETMIKTDATTKASKMDNAGTVINPA